MPTKHTVRQGECMVQIARQYGFADFEVVYDHPDNAELRRKRPNPNLLLPGDLVTVPDRQTPQVTISTGKVHTFIVKVPQRYLRLVLHRSDGTPDAGASYSLEIDGELRQGVTDGDGALEEKIPVRATTARLIAGEHDWRLQLGHLDPMRDVPEREVSGVQARLHNLGYGVDLGGRLTPQTRSAIRAFQHREGLEPTGRLDAKTLDKLQDRHGS